MTAVIHTVSVFHKTQGWKIIWKNSGLKTSKITSEAKILGFPFLCNFIQIIF